MFWTVTLCFTLLVLLLGYCHYRHQYWQTRGVFVPPTAPILGNLHMAFSKKENWYQFIHRMFMKSKGPFMGTYEILKPKLIIRDVSLVKRILVKDFDHFVDRRSVNLSASADRIFNEMLTNVTGEKWKALRSIVSPTFTSGKLKGLFPLISEKCQRLSKWCLTEGTLRDKVDMKELFGRFTLEGVATAAFGIESRCIEDEEDEFFKAVIEVMKSPSFRMVIKSIAFMMMPRLFSLLNIRIINPAIDYFKDNLTKTLELRKNMERRGDFLDLMMDVEKECKAGTRDNYPVTDDTIIAQSVLFLLAGYETTSTTLTFFAYSLAKHPEVQRQVREELRSLVDVHGEITYQAIVEAKFLDACMHETLRLYPPAPALERKCTKDYTLPGTDITLKEKMLVGIPVWTLNRDPDIWEDPEAFRPERFLTENKTPNQNFAFMSFGQGPRNCVGMRFAILEVKLAIAHLILNMELLLGPGHEGPLEFKVHLGSLAAKDGINLAFRPLDRN